MKFVDGYYIYRPRCSVYVKSFFRVAANFLGASGITLATAGLARLSAPFRAEYPQISMPLRNLPPAFEGFRLVQVSDLHTLCGTPLKFLRQVIASVNDLRPDLVAVTGDLVTHRLRHVPAACDIVSEIAAPTVVTFGNHDYARTWHTWRSSEVADALQAGLESRGITVLRNRAIPIDRAGSRIWIAGLEDLWSGRFSPARTFANTNPAEPIIALSHNPDSIEHLDGHGVQWVLCGHTHGGQVRVPVAGPLILPIDNKQYDRGLFTVGSLRMYVCRGIGFRVPVRFRCPPEIPCFVLHADSTQAAGQ